MSTRQEIIEELYTNAAQYNFQDLNKEQDEAIRSTISELDLGRLRVAEPAGDDWKVNEWAKKAILLFFRIQKMDVMKAGDFQYFDKIPLKKFGPEKLLENFV